MMDAFVLNGMVHGYCVLENDGHSQPLAQPRFPTWPTPSLTWCKRAKHFLPSMSIASNAANCPLPSQ